MLYSIIGWHGTVELFILKSLSARLKETPRDKGGAGHHKIKGQLRIATESTKTKTQQQGLFTLSNIHAAVSISGTIINNMHVN